METGEGDWKLRKRFALHAYKKRYGQSSIPTAITTTISTHLAKSVNLRKLKTIETRSLDFQKKGGANLSSNLKRSNAE